jgi:hypothetical protein
MTACAGFPLFWKRGPERLDDRGAEVESTAGGGGTARAELETRDILYDGYALSGRLLVSAVGRSLRVDKRLIESISLTTRSVVDCSTGQPVGFLEMDVLAPRPQEEDILVLEPGYWYGKEVKILLFSRHGDARPGPECVIVEIAFHAVDGRRVGSSQIRAVRVPRPAADAGVPTDAQSEDVSRPAPHH